MTKSKRVCRRPEGNGKCHTEICSSLREKSSIFMEKYFGTMIYNFSLRNLLKSTQKRLKTIAPGVNHISKRSKEKKQDKLIQYISIPQQMPWYATNSCEHLRVLFKRGQKGILWPAWDMYVIKTLMTSWVKRTDNSYIHDSFQKKQLGF